MVLCPDQKKKQAVNTPDPDADYTDDDDDEDYGAGEDGADGDDNVVVVSDTGSDPYEDEILADDGDDPEEV